MKSAKMKIFEKKLKKKLVVKEKGSMFAEI